MYIEAETEREWYVGIVAAPAVSAAVVRAERQIGRGSSCRQAARARFFRGHSRFVAEWTDARCIRPESSTGPLHAWDEHAGPAEAGCNSEARRAVLTTDSWVTWHLREGDSTTLHPGFPFPTRAEPNALQPALSPSLYCVHASPCASQGVLSADGPAALCLGWLGSRTQLRRNAGKWSGKVIALGPSAPA